MHESADSWALGISYSRHQMVSDKVNLSGKQFCLKNPSLISEICCQFYFSLWGTEPVTCMFRASHEAGNGLINSPRSSHTSNWESDMRLARGQGIFSKCMLMVATVYSEGSRKGLPSSKELGQAQPFGGTKALQWSRKTELMITINTCRAPADNTVLSSVQPQYQQPLRQPRFILEAKSMKLRDLPRT